MCLFLQADTPIFVGAGASGIATADLNADGFVDVVVASTGSRTLTVLTGDGHGGFASLKGYPLPGAPSGLGVGPFAFDGPGQALAAITSQQGRVSLLLDDGHGVFHAGTPLTIKAGDTGLIAADLTGTGADSVIAVNTAGGFVDVVSPDGTEATYPVAGLPGSVTAATLVGGAKPDVVVTTSTGVSVLRNDGTGHLGAAVAYATTSGAKSVIEATMTGKGRHDLVVASDYFGQTTVTVLPDAGHGGFGAPLVTYISFNHSTKSVAPPLAAADFDANGATDIVIGTQFGAEILFGSGHGGFYSSLYVPQGTNYYIPVVGVAVTSLTPHGRPDILTTLANGRLQVIHSGLRPFSAAAAAAGAGTLAPPGGSDGARRDLSHDARSITDGTGWTLMEGRVQTVMDPNQVLALLLGSAVIVSLLFGRRSRPAMGEEAC